MEPMSLDAKAWTKNSNNDNQKACKVQDAIDTKSNKVMNRLCRSGCHPLRVLCAGVGGCLGVYRWVCRRG